MTYDPSKFEADTSYDPAEFNIPANDSKGHNVMISFRVAHHYQRAIQAVLASRRFPYLTPSDLIRHALHRHLDWLTEIEEVAPARSLLSIIRSGNERMKAEEVEREALEHFALLQRDIDALLNIPDGVAEARRRISREISSIRQAPAGFYRDQYLGKLVRTFGDILDGKTKSLVKRLSEESVGESAESGVNGVNGEAGGGGTKWQ